MQFGITEGKSTHREVAAEVQQGGSFNSIYIYTYFPQNYEPWARSVTFAHRQNTLQHSAVTTIPRITIEKCNSIKNSNNNTKNNNIKVISFGLLRATEKDSGFPVS
jgi:hypothetical protein